MKHIKSINQKVIDTIVKKKEKQNAKLFNMLDKFFKKQSKEKIAFCLIYIDLTKEERVPVITNVRNSVLKVIFKHFVKEMEEGEIFNDEKE